MKLIIDIQDEVYDAMKIVQRTVSDQRGVTNLLQVLVDSVGTGNPFDSVIEDIKAEIDKIYERENSSFDCLNALDELKEFIDKHISGEKRDCKTCKYQKDGHCGYTEECHLCMFDNQHISGKEN